VAFYERAIALVPGHFGAHHYLIHSNEMIGQFDEALRHGKIYSDAASAVPHALHMYGHDLMKLGRTADAIAIFERARTLEHRYYDDERISRDFDWHHAHNTSLLALTYRHEGKLETAERLLRDAATVGQTSPARMGYYRGVMTDMLLARGKTEEALASARSMIDSPDPSTRTLGHALAARALLAVGRPADIAPHLAGMRSDDGGLYGFNGLQSELARGEHLLRSGREGEVAQGTTVLDDLIGRARLQRTPDGWIEGLYFIEAVFTVAQRANQPALAARAAQALMAHDKAYGGSHYAAAVLARAAGDAAAAARSFSEAARLWKDADPDFAPARESKKR
jgi:tetratricopeptide (TPR) repeat protein